MIENIKEELKNFITQNNGLEIYVYFKSYSEDDKYEVKKLNAQDELRDAIQRKLENRLIDKFCSETSVYYSLEEYDDRNDSFCVLDATEYEGLRKIVDLEDCETFYSQDDGNIQGIIYKYGTKDNNIIFYENFYPVNMIKKDNSLMGIVEQLSGSTQFKMIHSNIIRIMANIDIIIVKNYIIVNNFKVLESRFGFQKFIEKISNKNLDIIYELDLIEKTEKFQKYIGDYKVKKKIAKIKNSKVLNLDRKDIIQRIGNDEYYKNNIKISNGKIVINNKNDLSVVLKLLNDDILKSSITTSTYDATSKIEMK